MIRLAAALFASGLVLGGGLRAESLERVPMERPVSCRIEASQERGVTYLTAIVQSSRPLRGQAALSVETSGGAGRSANTQGASFAIDAAGGRAVVGRVGVSSGPGTVVNARLTAAWKGGETNCAYP